MRMPGNCCGWRTDGSGKGTEYTNGEGGTSAVFLRKFYSLEIKSIPAYGILKKIEEFLIFFLLYAIKPDAGALTV